MMKNTLKKIVDAFVSNASKNGRIFRDAIGTIASTRTLALALALGLALGAQAAENYTLVLTNGVAYKSTNGKTLGDVVSPAGLSYADGKWTMNGFNFETTAKTAVKVYENVTIEVSGSNSISNKTTSAYWSYGLYFDAGGTMNGDGTLTVSCEIETVSGEGGERASGVFNRTASEVVIGGSVTVVSTAKGDADSVSADGYSNANGTLTVQDSAVLTLSASTVATKSGNARGLYGGTVKVKDKARITASASGGKETQAVASASSSEPDAVATDTSSGAALTWNSQTYYKGSDIATDVTLKAKPGPVAEVTKEGVTTQYTSLPAAFEAIGANGTGEVKLLADVDLGVNGIALVPNGSDVTLELNGKRIFQTEDEDNAPITYESGTNGKLTINDSVGGGGITVNRASSAAADKSLNLHAVCCNGNGSLTVNGGTFAVTNNCGSAVIFYKEGNGTWNFNGGTFLAGSEGACSAQFLFCWGSTGKTFVTGGTYSCEAKDNVGIGIYVANAGTEQIEISNGDFDVSTKQDWSPAFEFYGTCVVKGGTFDVTSLATGAIGFNVKEGGKLIVSNGTFTVSAANNTATCLNATENARLEVAGGTFSAVSGTADGYTACSAIKGNQGSSVVITGAPVINQPTGGANDKFMVSVAGASLDFTGYTCELLGSIFVSNDGNTGFVKGDMSKCWWLSTTGGHFSTRPVEGKYWCADGMGIFANLDASTKDAYPWMVDQISTITPQEVSDATFKIYTNDIPVDAASVIVRTNSPAVVVYVAADGYFFADGTTAITNAIDTAVNPATAETPAAPIKVEIADVTARQRYPWNGKVDIAYTATNVLAVAAAKGVDVELKVTAIDKSTTPWTTNVAEAACLFDGPRGARTLPLDEALSNGTHRIVWDMNAQGLSNKSDKVVFTVSAEGKLPEPGLCFTALEDGSEVVVDMKNYNLEYSCDGGQTWEHDNENACFTNTLKKGEKLLVRATKDGNSAVGYYMNDACEECYPFKATGNLKLSGNVMYLLKQDGSQTEITDENVRESEMLGTCYCFQRLFFEQCAGITDASELKLANNTRKYCYVSMFQKCTGLTKVPALPAMTLAYRCYWGMFWECSSLVTVDENLLPATNMVEDCYFGMFKSCTALTQAPKLPATDLPVRSCYGDMFYGCTSLTTAPLLGAIRMPRVEGGTNTGQMMNMFLGCSKLSSVTLLATEIYDGTKGINSALLGWLDDAGTEATNPTLHVAKGMASNKNITMDTPSNWTIVEDAE